MAIGTKQEAIELMLLQHEVDDFLYHEAELLIGAGSATGSPNCDKH